MKNKTIYFIVLASLLMYQCIGFKPATNGGKISKYVEEFYTEGGVIQYFIKPLSYEDDTKNDYSFDFTFRNHNVKKDLVTVNFSVFTEHLDTINYINISTIGKNITNHKFTTLFTSKTTRNTKQRMSFKMKFKDIEEYFFNSQHIQIASKTDTLDISPTKKTIKAFEKLKISLVNNLK